MYATHLLMHRGECDAFILCNMTSMLNEGKILISSKETQKRLMMVGNFDDVLSIFMWLK